MLASSYSWEVVEAWGGEAYGLAPLWLGKAGWDLMMEVLRLTWAAFLQEFSLRALGMELPKSVLLAHSQAMEPLWFWDSFKEFLPLK